MNKPTASCEIKYDRKKIYRIFCIFVLCIAKIIYKVKSMRNTVRINKYYLAWIYPT